LRQGQIPQAHFIVSPPHQSGRKRKAGGGHAFVNGNGAFKPAEIEHVADLRLQIANRQIAARLLHFARHPQKRLHAGAGDVGNVAAIEDHVARAALDAEQNVFFDAGRGGAVNPTRQFHDFRFGYAPGSALNHRHYGLSGHG
jgi:hypothetical protein